MKKIDINALLKAVIFGAFGIAVFYMGFTDHLALVLHPKMFKFTYFAGFVFLLISIYMITKIPKASPRKADLRVLVFILPILFMFTDIQPLKGDALKNMSYDVLSNSKRIAQANIPNGEAQKSEVQKPSGSADPTKSQELFEENENSKFLEERPAEESEKNLKEANYKEGDSIKSGESETQKNENKRDETPEWQSSKPDVEGFQVPQDHNVVNNSSIIIDSDISSGEEPLYLPSVSETKGKNYDIAKFLDDMLEAYSFSGDGTNKFDHQEFEIVGFVYRDDYFEKNRFMVGRILLTCCISDAQQIGVLVEGEEDYTGKFSDDSWVKVRGKLFWQELYNPNTKEDVRVLTLKPIDIEKIENIAYPYVYFE